MPKQRNKKPRKIKHCKKRNDMIVFVIIGLCCSGLLWFLIKDPLPENSIQNTENAISDPNKSAKHKKSTKAKLEEATKQNKSNNSSEAKNEPEKQDMLTMDAAIISVLDKLDIPKSFYKRRKSAELITYSVPINKSIMDLTYANMIFKGDLERNGGKLLRGTDSSGKQSLTFASKESNTKYLINLYYDSKLFESKTKHRYIAIVVDDFGAIDGSLLDGFLSLDKEVCFAIFPDEPNSVHTMQKAAAQGRTTIIHTPMEPIGYPNVNPGKNAIFTQYSSAQIDKILTRFIHQLPDCEGINNHMGSLATTDDDVMRAVMTTLKKHNKFFLDSRTSNVSVAYSVAQKAHVRAFRNDLFLDSPNITSSTMDKKLSQIIDLSSTKNSIIAITHCHSEEKLRYLKLFISKLKAAGFTLVPLTEIGHYNVPEIL